MKYQGKCPVCGKPNHYPSDGLCMRCYAKLHEQRQQAAEWILYYHQRKVALWERLAELTELNATEYDGVPGGESQASATENIALKRLELERQRLWLVAVEDMMRHLNDRQKLFIELRREAEAAHFNKQDRGRPGWVDYVEAHYARRAEKMLGQYYLPRRYTMFEWWNKCINQVVQIAANYKILV